MKNYQTKNVTLSNSRGSVLILVSLLLVVFIAIAALAIDVGYVSATKNELQNVADASALAATGALGQMYLANGPSTAGPGIIGVSEKNTLDGIANTAAESNKAAGLNISVTGNIQVGRWNVFTNTFTPFADFTTPSWPNAVKVTAQRAAGSNGPISSFFAGMVGINSREVTADAIAALTGESTFNTGETELPIGLSHKQFDNNRCKDPLELHDTNHSCAGWHFFDGDLNQDGNPENHPNGNAMGDLLLGMILDYGLEGEEYITDNYTFPSVNQIPPTYNSPGIDENTSEFVFSGGTIASLFTATGNGPSPMDALFDFFKTRDGDYDDEGNLIDGHSPDTWTTTIPVYLDEADGDSCENPTGERLIVGTSDIIITAVHGPPDNYLDIEPFCNIEVARGGSGQGGTIGIIPNLVE